VGDFVCFHLANRADGCQSKLPKQQRPSTSFRVECSEMLGFSTGLQVGHRRFCKSDGLAYAKDRLMEELAFTLDVLPDMPSLMRRVCSGYAPLWGELQTPLV
jgi:hypothetical protein